MSALLDDFLVRAVLAGIGVALAAAPLGCVVVWRRMAYFGDATAHASILGVALALAFSTSVFVGALAVAFLMATAVSALSGRGFAVDTLLGVMAHASLAFGLVALLSNRKTRRCRWRADRAQDDDRGSYYRCMYCGAETRTADRRPPKICLGEGRL